MELKHLRAFVFVAETHSFSIAASRCCVTQSAISQHIKTLENELNCQLLIRDSHNVEITECGKALLHRAKRILKDAEDCKEQINAINNCMTGELRLGIGSFIIPYICKAAITFMERYPNVRISAEFTKACRLNSLLREHSIDLAFTMNTAHEEEGIESLKCIPFKIYAMMQDTNPLAAQKKVSYEDLIKHNIVMPDMGERVFNTFQQYLKRDLSKFNVKCIVSNADEALAIVEEMNCVTFLPKLYIRNRPTLVARPIIGLEKQIYSNAHWMKDMPMKRSAQLFLNILREESVPYIATLEENI